LSNSGNRVPERTQFRPAAFKFSLLDGVFTHMAEREIGILLWRKHLLSPSDHFIEVPVIFIAVY
jgi:hypothetical protein